MFSCVFRGYKMGLKFKRTTCIPGCNDNGRFLVVSTWNARGVFLGPEVQKLT